MTGRLLVAVETSSRALSVALFEDGRLVASREREGHGEIIIEIIDELLRERGITARDVGRWAVDVGPGSFTGVRSGVATVKGIVFATHAEIVGVTAFDALSEQGAVLIDAGKGEVYYRIGSGGEPGHASLDVARRLIEGRNEPVIGPGVVPRAEGVGRTALGRAPDDLDRLEPLYVRAPDLTKPR